MHARTVARWKMGVRKARFRNEEQVKGQERRWGEFPVYSDRSSYNRAAPSHRKSKSAEEGGPNFPGFLMAASWPNLYLEIKSNGYRKAGKHLYSVVVKTTYSYFIVELLMRQLYVL